MDTRIAYESSAILAATAIMRMGDTVRNGAAALAVAVGGVVVVATALTPVAVGTVSAAAVYAAVSAAENALPVVSAVVTAVDGIVVVTVKATFTPDSRWRRDASVMLVMVMALLDTPSVEATADLKAVAGAPMNEDLVYPERDTVTATTSGAGGPGGDRVVTGGVSTATLACTPALASALDSVDVDDSELAT